MSEVVAGKTFRPAYVRGMVRQKMENWASARAI
jgi:hypothetical protein